MRSVLTGVRRTARIGLVLALVVATPARAQFPGGGRGGSQGPAREVAPIDVTGQWVSVVTEDWRFRMVTPPKGDYPGLPLNAAAREIADNWDPARDEAEGNECKAYGAGGIMRMPGRLRISWADARTLEMRTDAGRQRRVLHFDAPPEPDAERSWQGISAAQWEMHRAGGGFRGSSQAPVNGTLKVVTTGMSAGYFRTNGVPYSEDAVLTEYYDLFHEPDGTDWLVVLSVLDDPTYFTSQIITSTNFRRETDRSGWDPRPCEAR